MRQAFKIDASALASAKSKIQAELNRHLSAARSKFAKELRETAGELAMELADRTFPSDGAIGYTVRSVRGDVASVYVLPGRVFEVLQYADPAEAGAFWSAMKRGDLSRARQIVRRSGTYLAGIEIGAPLRPSHHTSARDPKTGNVILEAPLQMVTKQERDDYTRLVVREIGKTASGWMACADDLGADGNFVRWKGIAVHGKNGGSVRIQISATRIAIILVNHRHLARKHISPGQLQSIRREANEKLLRRLEAQSKQLTTAA
jgi:hypothetical protein